jgi:hypothetical protein
MRSLEANWRRYPTCKPSRARGRLPKGVHHEAIRPNRPGVRPPGGEHALAELIIGGSLVSTDITAKAPQDQGVTVDGGADDAA